MMALSMSSMSSSPHELHQRLHAQNHRKDADTFQWAPYPSSFFPRQVLGNQQSVPCNRGSTSPADREQEAFAKQPPAGPIHCSPFLSSQGSWRSDRNTKHTCESLYSLHHPSPPSDTQNCCVLHHWEFNSRGRLPCEASFEFIMGAMDDAATQPSTQPVLRNSKPMVTENDAADVLCLLMPASGPALRAVDLIARTSPQHILQNPLPDVAEELEYDLAHEMPTTTRTEVDDEFTSQMPPPQKPVTVINKGGSPRDIALRMSSQVHNPCMGFVFGRNPARCDLLLSNEETMKLSNSHFRVFVNRHGVLMVEDTSTNGTIVDKHLLSSDRSNRKSATSQSTRSLNNGSVIELPTMNRPDAEWLRFIVRFPPRDNHQEDYNQNLASYLNWIQQQERQIMVAAQKNGGVPPSVIHPFNPLNHRAEASPNASIIGAATGDNIHGVDWNGGPKYKFIKTIGKGAFAMVYQLVHTASGEIFACKQIEKRRFVKDGLVNHKVHNEIKIMKDLEHTNIVKYIEYHETKSNLYIVMEFVQMGDLSVYTESGRAMPEYMCQMMTMQMLNALQYLHERGITHRDIKPDNILVASHQPYTFKLSDFGLSKLVADDKTFLKSFCGTLLYCAPEIYPGFQRAKMGLHPSKRTRSWEPRKGTMPYEHSVDVWSIAAVLFHLLSGHSPYTGSMEDEGALMLMNIMKTSPNWEFLEQAGISSSGQDFVQQALVIDPAERARETDLLSHRWLTGSDGHPLDPFKVSVREDDVVLDASQLSLQEKPSRETDWRTQETMEDADIENPRESKRTKYFQESEAEAPVDLFNGPTGSNWYGATAQWNDSQASINSRNDLNQFMPGLPDNRLFGEIGSSALRSSGVLGSNAQGALGMQSEGSNAAAEDDSYMHPETEGEEGPSFVSPHDVPHAIDHSSDEVTQESLQYPRILPGEPYAGAAPSLYGAEALVDQLRMTSPESSTSAPSADSKPTTPKTPRDFDASKSQEGLNHSGDSISLPQNQVTPKPAKGGRSNPAVKPNESHDSEMGGHGSRDEFDSTDQLFHSDVDDQYYTSENPSGLESDKHEDGQRMNTSHVSSTAPSSQGSDQGSNAPPEADHETDSTAQHLSHPVPGLPPPAPVTDSAASNDVKTQDVFLKPQPRFGVLTPTRESIEAKIIKLETRCTSFGRDPKCSVTHANPMDDRIPKLALDIAFWYPGIERDTRQGKNSWHQKSNLVATISTRANTFIKINGIHLMKSKPDKKLFGKLYRDDEVTIFEHAKSNECLKFKCNFFVGQSRFPRSVRNPFKVVEMDPEEEKRMQEQREAKRKAARAAKAAKAAAQQQQQNQQQHQSGAASSPDLSASKANVAVPRSSSAGRRASSVVSRSSAGRVLTRNAAHVAAQAAGTSAATSRSVDARSQNS